MSSEKQTQQDPKLAELNRKIKEAEDNESDIELRDALLHKADYYLNNLKDFTNARINYKLALDKTASK